MASLTKEEVIALAKEHAPNLPPELALSVYEQESSSGKNTNHTPSNGLQAFGGFGVTDIAAKDVGLAGVNLSDPVINGIVGLKYLEKQYVQSNKDPFQAAARYFGGPNAMNNLDIADANKKTIRNYATEVVSRTGIPQASYSNEERRNGGVSSVASAPGIPPNEDTSLFDNMMNAFGVSQKANASAVVSIDSAAANFTEAMNKVIEATTARGELLRNFVLDAANAKISRAGAAANNAAIAGISKDDPNSQFALGVQEYQQNAEEARILNNAIKDASKVSFLDDPMQFLTNQFVTIPQLTDAHNATVKVANAAEARVKDLNSMVQTQNITDNATISDISVKGAIAHADAQVQEAIINAQTLRKTGEAQLAQLAINKASIQNKTLNEFQQLQQMKFMEDYRKQIRAAAKDADALKKLTLEQKKAFEADLATLGYTPQTFAGLKGDNRERVAKMIETGRMGDTPMDSIFNMRLIPNVKLTPGQAKLSEMFVQIYQNSPIEGNKLLPKKEDKIAAGNKVIQDTFAQWRSNPTQGEDNPYKMSSPFVMTKLVTPANFSEPFVKAIKTIGETTQGSRVEDLAIVQTAVAQIGKDGYTREQAISDLSKYYKIGITNNNSTFRYQDFGINTQVDYKTQLRIPEGIMAAKKDKETTQFQSTYGIFGTTIKVDLANEAAVGSLVTLLLAKNMASKGSLSRARQEQGVLQPAPVE